MRAIGVVVGVAVNHNDSNDDDLSRPIRPKHHQRNQLHERDRHVQKPSQHWNSWRKHPHWQHSTARLT